MNGDDEVILRFLCETIHPVVRPDVTDAERLCQLYNRYLENDGFQLVEKTRMSGKLVFVGRYVGVVSAPGIAVAREALLALRLALRRNSSRRAAGQFLLSAVSKCHGTLTFRSWSSSPAESSSLTPNDIPEQAKAADTIKRLLSNLATITQGIAELRNQYGTGHGKQATTRGLNSRHAKLAVGAASTLAVFLAETHRARTGASRKVE